MSRARYFYFITGGILFLSAVIAPVEIRAGYDYQFDTNQPKMGQIESEMGTKFTRGVINVMLGWTEIARTPVEIAAAPDRGPLVGFIAGVPWGAIRAVARTVVGAYEVGTFYSPQGPVMRPIEGTIS